MSVPDGLGLALHTLERLVKLGVAGYCFVQWWRGKQPGSFVWFALFLAL
jgi:hypothetical protein